MRRRSSWRFVGGGCGRARCTAAATAAAAATNRRHRRYARRH